MKSKLLVLSCLALSFGYQQTKAQTLTDNAFTISRDLNSGTARFKAMGGVNTALGGDISSISGNPAGLGFYGQSDVSVTVGYFNSQNKAEYFGNSTTMNNGKFGIENAGVVIHYPTYNNTDFGWKNFNFGISLDRQNNFNDYLKYSGTNTESTILHEFTELMEATPSFGSEFMGSYLVDRKLGENGYYFPTVLEADPKNQQYENEITGQKYQTSISFGANYSNKFYIGAKVGIVSLNYDSKKTNFEKGWTKTAEEIRRENPQSNFGKPGTVENGYTDLSYELTDIRDVKIKGVGANFGIGMIFKPTWDWNIGVNITSPTWTEVQEEAYIETIVDYYRTENSSETVKPGYGSPVENPVYDYAIVTPWKTSVGFTKFFGRGLLSADVEYVNYQSIKYRETVQDPDYNFENSENYKIEDTYKGAFNLNVGGEVLITDRLAARAGFRLLSSPYKGSETSDYIYSAGLGYVISKSFYVDLTGMMYKSLSFQHNPYWIENNQIPLPTANVKNTMSNAVLTIGAKF